MNKNIDAFFDRPRKMFYYDWTTWDTLNEVDRLMESHHGWRPVDWKSLHGTKEIAAHSVKKRALRAR